MSKISLNTPQALSVPTATNIELNCINIDLRTNQLIIKYEWRNAAGVIVVNGTVEQELICENSETANDFNQFFGFNIRAQDVGKTIGMALKQLVFNHMKTKLLASGNDGTVE